MRGALADLRTGLGQVFAIPWYGALAGVLAAFALVLAVWFPNLGLIGEIFSGSNAPLGDKVGIALSLLGGIATNFNLLTAASTITIAALFGLCAAMIAYLIRQKRMAAAGRNIAIGSGGMASGMLGIGCAACGSLLLGGAIPFAGAAAALGALPLGGAEFGILSVALLFVSLLLVARAIARPAGCELPRATHPPRQ